jgi:hypothetical protein
MNQSLWGFAAKYRSIERQIVDQPEALQGKPLRLIRNLPPELIDSSPPD